MMGDVARFAPDQLKPIPAQAGQEGQVRSLNPGAGTSVAPEAAHRAVLAARPAQITVRELRAWLAYHPDSTQVFFDSDGVACRCLGNVADVRRETWNLAQPDRPAEMTDVVVIAIEAKPERLVFDYDDVRSSHPILMATCAECGVQLRPATDDEIAAASEAAAC